MPVCLIINAATWPVCVIIAKEQGAGNIPTNRMIYMHAYTQSQYAIDKHVKETLEAPGKDNLVFGPQPPLSKVKKPAPTLEQINQMKSEDQILALYDAFVERDWKKFIDKQTQHMTSAKKNGGAASTNNQQETQKLEDFFKDRCVYVCVCVCMFIHVSYCVDE